MVSFLSGILKLKYWLLIAIAIIVVELFVVAKRSGSQSNNIPPTFLHQGLHVGLFMGVDLF